MHPSHSSLLQSQYQSFRPARAPLLSFFPLCRNKAMADIIIKRYPSQYKKAALLPLLELGQRQNKGWTSISVM